MSTADVELVRQAYAALASGRLNEAEQVLHPDAQWLGVEPGPWDCIGREQVVATMRERVEQGAVGELEEIREAGDAVLLTMIATPEVMELLGLSSDRTYILVECDAGRVVRMRDFASADDALAAARS
jgi:ketosteroid isomerase-like protein